MIEDQLTKEEVEILFPGAFRKLQLDSGAASATLYGWKPDYNFYLLNGGELKAAVYIASSEWIGTYDEEKKKWKRHITVDPRPQIY
jgi:hypothetical protein